MKISVVTAVYNRRDTIADAVKSVISQTHPFVEHIVQDGGSDDGTLSILKSLETKRTFIRSERDSGIYNAINKGISRATGDVIGLVHSDDYFASNTVLHEVAVAFERTGADGIYGDLNYVARSDTSRVIRHWKSGEYCVRRFAHGWMPPHPALFLRREVFDHFGCYDERYRIAADYDAILRWFAHGNLQLAYIPKVLVTMRTGGESNRSIRHIARKTREDYAALRRNQVGGLGTLFLKNISKVPQFFTRGMTP